jgi:hypothetical protein
MAGIAMNLFLIWGDHWSDFPGFYAAAKLLGTDRLYDPEAVRTLVDPLTSRPDLITTVRIPANYLSVWPASLLSYDTARIIWTACLLASLGVVIWLYPSRRYHLILALALFGPVTKSVWIQQDSLILLAAFAAALSFEKRGNERAAGLFLSVLLFKPYIAILIPLVLLISRRRKTFVWFCTGALVLAAVSVLIQRGVSWIPGLISILQNPANSEYPGIMLSVRSLSASLGLPFALFAAPVVIVGLSAVRMPFAPAMAVCLAAGTLAGYHVYEHDFVFILPLMVATNFQNDIPGRIAASLLVPFIPRMADLGLAWIPVSLALGLLLSTAVASLKNRQQPALRDV